MSTRLGIVGGYLGSGKSTLINRVLTGATLGRTAVVVNDFGSVNIDADLIASADGDTLELTNGCICCQATDDTTRVMTDLAGRADLDHVLCEVSGVGDPGQLASWRSFPGFLAGPVLVCADVTRVVTLLHDEYVGDTVARQLASAEVVLVTKTDLCEPEECDAGVAACREAAGSAEVILQSRTDPGASAGAALAVPPVGEDPGDTAARETHTDTHRTQTLTATGPVDVETLRTVLIQHSRYLARAKGIVRGRDGTWHEIHLSGARVEVRSLPSRITVDSPALVLIAAGPDAGADLERVRTALPPVFPRSSGPR